MVGIPRGRVISFETEREAFKPLEHPIDVRAGLLLGEDALDNDEAIFVEGVAPITSLGSGVNIVRHDSAGNGIVEAPHKALSAGALNAEFANPYSGTADAGGRPTRVEPRESSRFIGHAPRKCIDCDGCWGCGRPHLSIWGNVGKPARSSHGRVLNLDKPYRRQRANGKSIWGLSATYMLHDSNHVEVVPPLTLQVWAP